MRTLLAFSALLASSLAGAETTYLGLYLQGSKIGYASYSSSAITLKGRPATRSDSRTMISAGMLGTPMTFQTDSTTWSDPSGRPTRMLFRMESAGRTQSVDATFGAAKATMRVNNSGAKRTITLPVPKDGRIVEDPLSQILTSGTRVGTTRSFYVLDPTTVSFVKNDVRLVGKAKTTVRGKSFDATLVTITEPRASMKIYVSGKTAT